MFLKNGLHLLHSFDCGTWIYIFFARFTWNISEMFCLLKVRMKVKITNSNTNAFSDHCHIQNMFPGAV